MPADEPQLWVDWAPWMMNKYQRTSSVGEGRSDYLTQRTLCLNRRNATFDLQTYITLG